MTVINHDAVVADFTYFIAVVTDVIAQTSPMYKNVKIKVLFNSQVMSRL